MTRKQRDRLEILRDCLTDGTLGLVDFSVGCEHGEICPALAEEERQLVAGAIRIPALRSSVLSRSKDVENRVARYLWGPEALRNWQDREDLRDDEHKWVVEVKSYHKDTVLASGGPWGILNNALDQAIGVIRDVEGLAYYAPAAVLVIPRMKLERSLTILPVRTAVGVVGPVIVTLLVFKELYRLTDVQDMAARYAACAPLP